MNSNHRQADFFRVAIIIIGITLALFFAVGKDAIQLDRRGDSAIHEQIISNIWAGKGAVSNVFSATQNFIDRRYTSQSINDLVVKKLEPPDTHDRNMLHFHAYYILFFIAPLTSFMSSSLALTLLQSICFFGVLIAAALFLWRETNSRVVALMFLPIIVFNPNWVGGLYGQFYPDRLFLIAGFSLCYACYRDVHTSIILLLAVIVLLINERAALIGGVILLYMPWLAIDIKNKFRYIGLRAVLGVCLIIYAYVQKTYILTNLYYVSFLPDHLEALAARFLLDGFLRNNLIFISINSAMLILSLIKPRFAFLALIVMLPNIIGNIGGAEKTGWLTHYHSYYFPLLIFSSAIGFLHIYRKYSGAHHLLNRKNIISIYVGLLLMSTVQYWQQTSSYRLPSWGGLLSPIESLYRVFNNLSIGYDVRKNIATLFPEGELVSTDELGMALLHDRVSVDMFPVAAINADYLFLPCQLIKNYTNENFDIEKPHRIFSFNNKHNYWFKGRVNSIDYCVFLTEK